MDADTAIKYQKEGRWYKQKCIGLVVGWRLHMILNVYPDERCPTGHIGVARVQNDKDYRYRIPLYMIEEYVETEADKPTKASRRKKPVKSSRRNPAKRTAPNKSVRKKEGTKNDKSKKSKRKSKRTKST